MLKLFTNQSIINNLEIIAKYSIQFYYLICVDYLFIKIIKVYLISTKLFVNQKIRDYTYLKIYITEIIESLQRYVYVNGVLNNWN